MKKKIFGKLFAGLCCIFFALFTISCKQTEIQTKIDPQFQAFLNFGNSSDSEKNIDVISQYIYSPEIISQTGSFEFKAIQAVTCENAMALIFEAKATDAIDVKIMEDAPENNEVMIYKGDIIDGNDTLVDNSFLEKNKNNMVGALGKASVVQVRSIDDEASSALIGIKYAVKNNSDKFEKTEKYTVVINAADDYSAFSLSADKIIESEYIQLQGDGLSGELLMSPLCISIDISVNKTQAAVDNSDIEMKDANGNILYSAPLKLFDDGTKVGENNESFSKVFMSEIYNTDYISSINLYGQDFSIN